MSIIGNPFEDWVKKQINVRQSAVAKMDEKSLLAYTTKTPWLRLASSVSMLQSIEGDSIKDGATVYERLKASNIFTQSQLNNMLGADLAKNFVLFGGASSYGGNMPAGLNPSDQTFGGAYGWGSLGSSRTKRGYVPMPGLTGCSFEYKNDGALAFAKVDMVAYSEDQFQIIDILFQRPGYTCLLEFGHSSFLDNNGNLQYAGQGNYTYQTEPFVELFNESRANNANFSTLVRKIRNEKKKWCGNYEGFFGKITKYNWSIQNDGSYKITVELVGAGDLLASLKTNSGPIGEKNTSLLTGAKIDKPSEKEEEDAEAEGNEAERIPVIADAVSSRLNLELFNLYMTMPGGGSTDWGTFATVLISDFPFYDKETGKTTTKNYIDTTGRFGFGIDSAQNPQKDKMVYLRFISFLAILQKLVNIKDDAGNYAINFDFNFENPGKDENYICTFPGNFSGDPNEVLINYTNVTSTITTAVSLVTATDINEELGKRPSVSFQHDSDRSLGKLANVFVEIDFITKCLYELRDEETGDVPFYPFLKKVLDAINRNLGGINTFRVLYDEVTNTVTIISETPQNSVENNPDQLATFNTFGLNDDGKEGSFIRSFDLKAELNESFATLISVGSQSNGSRNNANATAFSTYNKGLIDRLTPIKAEATEDEDDLDDNAPKDEFDALWTEEVADAFDEVYEGYELGSDYVSPLKNVVGNWSKKAQAKLYQEGKSEPNIFLPFNFSMTLDGLAGMKIYEAFRTDGKGLPYQYKTDSIGLIIKSYSHSVGLDGWTTKIETICKPLTTNSTGQSTRTTDSGTIAPGKPKTYVKKNQGGENAPPLPAPAPAQNNEDEKVRVVLRRIADNGLATYGVMWVFDKDEKTVLYTLATIELPWKNNQNGVSCIPPNDKYRVKAMVSSKYGGCFHVIGNEKNEWRYDQLRAGASDQYSRSSVLIHTAPKAVGWLMGCIGPAFTFNGTQVTGTSDKGFDSSGNNYTYTFTGTAGDPKSTGTSYLDPAKGQSSQALAKMYGTLAPEGSFKMRIKNLGDVGPGQLPKSIYDQKVKDYVKEYSAHIAPIFKDLKGFG